MENHLHLIQWFKKMGYDYQISEDQLMKVYNKSTSFMWNELMQNAKPKQEVDNIRCNVIINRLRTKPSSKQDEFSYPIQNIILNIRKRTLEKKRNNIQSLIEEKKHIINNQSNNNKIKYIAIEKLKSQIRENREREYLLGRRCKMLEKNIQDAEETLTFAKNLTPVELDENPNSAEITDTLQKCAEKLEKLLKELPAHHNYNNSTQKFFRFYSAQKESRTQSNFEKYLLMSERKHSEKITIIKHGGTNIRGSRSNKENTDSDRKINKNLFANIKEEYKRTENKRESLGILQDSYLNENELNCFAETDSVKKYFSNLVNINLDIPSPKEHFSLNYTLQLNEHHNVRNTSQMPKHFSFDKLYNDEFVTKSLKNLLHNHNRQIIWNTFQTLNDNLHFDVTKNNILECRKNEKSKNINQEDIAKLQYLHVQIEMQILKLKVVLREMLNKVLKKKKLIHAAINNTGLQQEQVEHTRKVFELQFHDICLDIALTEMKKEINSVRKNETNNDLHIIQGKIMQTKEDIVHKLSSVKQYISEVSDILQSTVHTREATITCVRKIGPFVEDLTWSVPLTQSLCSTEIKTFEKFPLEYNRRCIYTDRKTLYRDISDDIPGDADLDSNILYMLTNILESPFSPPEMVVLQILKCKMKLNAFKTLPNQSTCDYKKYSLKQLQAQESYVQYALDKLNSIIFSTTTNNTFKIVEHMKNVMEIWLEMPLKDYISHNRIVNGHDYKFYEKQYDNFYNDC